MDKVEDRDRGFTQDLAFGTARWQPRLSALAAKLLQKPFKAADADVEALLLVGLYQLLYTRVPAHAAIGETVGCADKLKKSPGPKPCSTPCCAVPNAKAKRCWPSWSTTRWCAPLTHAGCKKIPQSLLA